MKRAKGFILGVVSTLIVFSLATTAYAAVTGRTIDIVDGIKIFLYGEPLEMTDVNSDVVEPFIHNGTTYVPVRGLSEALGQAVAWDSESKAVYIDKTLAPDERLNVNKITVTHFDMARKKIIYTIDFQNCQLITEGFNNWVGDSYFMSGYISSVKQLEFVKAVTQYDFLDWNNSDWEWYDTDYDYEQWDGVPLEEIIYVDSNLVHYSISVMYEDGSEWVQYAVERFPQNWNEMRQAFSELTGKDILIHDSASNR